MKPTLPALITFLALSTATAQTPTFAWVKTIVDLKEPTETYVDLFDIQTDRNTGQTFVFGYFQGNLDFDSQTALSTPPNSAAYFLAKYNTDGAVKWARKIGPISDAWPPGDTTGGGVETDAAGNVYITGKFFGQSLRFDAAHELLRNCPSNCADIFVAKYSPSGDFLWAKGISGAKSGIKFDADGLALAANGNLYLTGNYNGSQLVYGIDQTFTDLRPEGYFLAQIRPDDGKLEQIHFPFQEGFVVAEQLQVAADGNVWVGGYYGNGPVDFGNGVALTVYGNPDFLEYFLVRYDPQGEAQEAINFNSSSELFFMPEIAAMPDTSLLIIHDFRKTLRRGTELLKQTSANAAILTRYKADTVSLTTFVPYSGSTVEPVSTPIASVAVGSRGQFVTGGYFGSSSLLTPAGLLQNAGNCSDIVLLAGHADFPMEKKGYRFGGGSTCEGIVNFYPGHSMRTDTANNLYICGLFAEDMNLGGVTQDGYGLFVAKMRGAISATAEPVLLAELLSMQPNPTSGAFRIAFAQPDPEGVFVVYDVHGKAVFRTVVNAPVLDLHLHLPDGTYVCAFLGKKGVERGRLVLLGRE